MRRLPFLLAALARVMPAAAMSEPVQRVSPESASAPPLEFGGTPYAYTPTFRPPGTRARARWKRAIRSGARPNRPRR